MGRKKHEEIRVWICQRASKATGRTLGRSSVHKRVRQPTGLNLDRCAGP